MVGTVNQQDLVSATGGTVVNTCQTAPSEPGTTIIRNPPAEHRQLPRPPQELYRIRVLLGSFTVSLPDPDSVGLLEPRDESRPTRNISSGRTINRGTASFWQTFHRWHIALGTVAQRNHVSHRSEVLNLTFMTSVSMVDVRLDGR